MSGEHMVQPTTIPNTISQVVDLNPAPAAPGMSETTGPLGGNDLAGRGVPGGAISGPIAALAAATAAGANPSATGFALG